jgi:hypothetical protein
MFMFVLMYCERVLAGLEMSLFFCELKTFPGDRESKRLSQDSERLLKGRL